MRSPGTFLYCCTLRVRNFNVCRWLPVSLCAVYLVAEFLAQTQQTWERRNGLLMEEGDLERRGKRGRSMEEDPV